MSKETDAKDEATTEPVCANATTQLVDKYCDVSAAALNAIRVKATLGGSTQSFPTLYFGKTKGVLKLTSATSPRPVDWPGYFDDGLTLPTVTGVTWKVGGTDVDLTALKRGFHPISTTTATPSATVVADVNTADYIVADDSYGLQWDFTFDVQVKDADVSAPGVLDQGGITTDAVVVPHAAQAIWYVNGRRTSTNASRPGQVRTNGKTLTVVATPLPGYKIPATITGPEAGLKPCIPITEAVKGAKPGSVAWTCEATATPQTIDASAFTGKTPTVGKDLGGTKDDSITLAAVPGVRWQVTTPAGVRTYSVTSGTKTFALGYSAKTFGDDYTVAVKPVVASAADYSFDTGADAAVELSLTSTLTAAYLTDAVQSVPTVPQAITITGVEGVSSWKITDAGKARVVRVKTGTTARFRTTGSSEARVTPVFAYGYGESTTSAVGPSIAPAPPIAAVTP